MRRSDRVDAMTHASSTRQAPGVAVGLLVALLVLIVEEGAGTVVGVLTRPNFAPEIGPLGAFVVFSLVLSAYVAPPFLLVACPFLWLARPDPARKRWPICTLTAVLVAAVVFLVSSGLDDRRSDTLYITAVSLLPAGIGASVVLRCWNAGSPRRDQIA